MWCGAASERTTSSRDTPGLTPKNRTRQRLGPRWPTPISAHDRGLDASVADRGRIACRLLIG